MDIDPLSRLKKLIRVEQRAKIFPSDLDLAIDEIAQEKGAHNRSFKNILREPARLPRARHTLGPDHDENGLI